MKLLRISLLTLFMTSFFFSCKNEADIKPENVEATVTEDERELTKNQTAQVNSVLTKMMVTPELKTFTSATITAGITDMLQKEEGPFTILAPSNSAFNSLSKERLTNLLNPSNKETLVTILKSHMIKDNLTSAQLTAALRNANEFKLKTLSGAQLVIYKEGNNLMIKDTKGNVATLGKSDIVGSNGVVHVVSGLLNLTK